MPWPAIWKRRAVPPVSGTTPWRTSGSRIFATERTLAYLKALDADYFAGAEGTLPSETFEGEREVKIGGKTLRLIHPGRGHTDGDLVVLFVEDRVPEAVPTLMGTWLALVRLRSAVQGVHPDQAVGAAASAVLLFAAGLAWTRWLAR